VNVDAEMPLCDRLIEDARVGVTEAVALCTAHRATPAYDDCVTDLCKPPHIAIRREIDI